MFQQLVVADFKERVRRHAFIVTLAFTVYAAYVFLPANGAPYRTLQVGGARGLYSSAWVGCTVAMLTSAFLSLAGFYLVKNAVERDRATGVGQILATTPISKPLYTLGKAASNFAVLAVLAGAVAVCAMAMQLLRAEDMHLRPLELLAPFLIATLPALAVVAALAVLFEAISWLRGGLGNVVYFFVWGALATSGASMLALKPQPGIGGLLGESALIPQMAHGVTAAFPDIDLATSSVSLGFNFTRVPAPLRTFEWSGLQGEAATLLPRLAWVAIAAAIALLAAIPFDRFDLARVAPSPRRRKAGSDSPPPSDSEAMQREISARPAIELRTIARRDARFGSMLRAELLLVRKDMPHAWVLIAIALTVACAVAPLSIARPWLLPFAWIWPVLQWSALGARENRHGTQALLFSAPHPLGRQLPATWLSGCVIALAMGIGVGVRLALAHDAGGAIGWLAGAVFIPSMALACGVWTGSGKLFEILYLLLWYLGPMNHVPFLDYAATTPASIASGAPQGFAVATLVLLALAVAGRARRLRR